MKNKIEDANAILVPDKNNAMAVEDFLDPLYREPDLVLVLSPGKTFQ
jgi:hypothetical protein